MGKALVALEYSLLALATSAIIFWNVSKNRLDDWRVAELITASILLIVTSSALVVAMKAIPDLLLSNRMTLSEAEGWASTRANGKLSYFLNALIIAGIPILVAIAAFEAAWYPSESMGHIVIPCITSFAFVGVMVEIVWTYQEWVFSRERGERPVWRLSNFFAKH